MADEKTSQLSAASALDGTELVPVVQGGTTKRTTAQAIADLGGGGGVPDPLDISSTSIGADGDSGWPGGAQQLLKYDIIDDSGEGNGLWEVLRIGKTSGPFGSEMVYDPYWTHALNMQQGTRTVWWPGVDYNDSYDINPFIPDLTGFQVATVFYAAGAWYMDYGAESPGHASATIAAPVVGTEGLLLEESNSGMVFQVVQQDGSSMRLKLLGMPVADPAIVGHVYEFSSSSGDGATVLTDLATALANGQKILLVSNGP